MPYLHLHIGPMKTGSTWLQEAFLLNAGRLEKAGIVYPLIEDAGREVDADKRVPTGNARTLLDDPARLSARLWKALPQESPRRAALFSSEVLFNKIPRKDDPAILVDQARRAGFDGLRLLMFARAPVPLATSVWQQRVKGWQAETRDLDTFLRTRSDWPERIVALVDKLHGIDGLEVTLRNYDAYRGDLLVPVEEWLGLNRGALMRPESTGLNRSLTRAETEFQRVLNRRLGASGQIFAFRIVNRVPGVPADPPLPQAETIAEVMARHGPALDRLDEILPSSEPVSREARALPDPAPPLALDMSQIEIIAEGLADYVEAPFGDRLRRTAKRLRSGAIFKRR